MRRFVLAVLALLTITPLFADMTLFDFASTATAEEMYQAIENGLEPDMDLYPGDYRYPYNGDYSLFLGNLPIAVVASSNPDSGALEALIEAGADMSVEVNDMDILSLSLRLDLATLEAVKILLPYSSAQDALYYASGHSTNPAIVAFLADEVGNLNTKGDSYYLMIAAENGMADNVSVLLEKGANPGSVFYEHGNYWNCLMLAASSGSVETCQVLVDAGLPADIENEDGETALMYAGSGEVVDFFCSEGLNPGKMVYSRTALRHALTNYRFDAVSALLRHGQEDEFYGDSYQAVLDTYYLVSESQKANLLFLIDALDEEFREDFLNHLLLLSFEKIREDSYQKDWLLNLLLLYGYDWSTRFEDGNTVLHLAAMDEDLCPYIPRMVERGAEVDVRNDEGHTPLYYALGVFADNLRDDAVFDACTSLIRHGGSLESVLEEISGDLFRYEDAIKALKAVEGEA